jgi:hypothetical protein
MFEELGPWRVVPDGSPAAYLLASQHYSFRRGYRRVGDKRIVGPGEHLVLMTYDYSAVFVWRRSLRPDLAGQSGICCSLFRNIGDMLSSWLILEAEKIALMKWRGRPARFYTYVNPYKVKSSNPGFCFKKAGWVVCGRTKGGIYILEKVVLDENN